jgi:hypothetical protein
MKTILTIGVLLILSGCATYSPGPSPISVAVLPESCNAEDLKVSEIACGYWFYELGTLEAKYDVERMGYYSPSREMPVDEYVLNRFAQGYRAARTTLGAPSVLSYQTKLKPL